MPVKAGIQNYLKTLDSRLRGNDAKGRFKSFYESINIERSDIILDENLREHVAQGFNPAPHSEDCNG